MEQDWAAQFQVCQVKEGNMQNFFCVFVCMYVHILAIFTLGTWKVRVIQTWGQHKFAFANVFPKERNSPSHSVNFVLVVECMSQFLPNLVI